MKTRKQRLNAFAPLAYDVELGATVQGVKSVSWVDDWTETDRIRARFDRRGGRVIAFCVQYDLLVKDKWTPVIRIDANSKERPHLHYFDPDGSDRKRVLIDKWSSLAGAFHEALASMKGTFEEQKERFVNCL